MNIKGSVSKIDKEVVIKAVGLMLLSWGALPLIYIILLREKRRKKEEKNDKDSGIVQKKVLCKVEGE
jgi:hypothetical protein